MGAHVEEEGRGPVAHVRGDGGHAVEDLGDEVVVVVVVVVG